MKTREGRNVGPNKDAIAWVLYQGPRSTSLAPLPPVNMEGAGSVAMWAANRLSRTTCRDVIQVLHAAADPDTFGDQQAVLQVSLNADPHITRVLLKCIDEHALAHVVLVSVEAALLSTERLNSFLAAHVARRAAVTRGAGLPIGIELYGFSRAYLERVRQLYSSDLPFHPGRGKQVADLVTAAGESPNKQGTLRYQDMNIGSQREARWPARVDLSTPAGVERLRVSLTTSVSSSLLSAWQGSEIEERKKLYRAWEDGCVGRSACSVKSLLLVSNACGYSGAEGSLVELVKEIDPTRYKVHVLVSMGGFLADALRPHVLRCVVYGDDFTRYSTSTMLRLRAIVEDIKPDVMHFNSLEGMPLIYLCIAMGIPYIQHIRNGDLRGFEAAIEGATALVTVSQYLASKPELQGASTNRLRVVYDEVDTEHFSRKLMSRSAARTDVGVPLDSFIVLCIARFVPNKRHDILLRAIANLRRRVPQLTVVLKGDSYGAEASYSEVLSLIDAHGLNDVVVHMQFAEDLRPLYIASDVLVLCSDDEGLGRCVVEAMSMEVPVMVTESGGSHEIVADGTTGVVIQGGSADALEEALYNRYIDPVGSERMGASGRSFALQNLTAYKSAQDIMCLYDDVLGDTCN